MKIIFKFFGSNVELTDGFAMAFILLIGGGVTELIQIILLLK